MYTPSQLGMPDWSQGQSSKPECECEHCRAQAEAVERSAAKAARASNSSNNSSFQMAPPGTPGFDYSKALGDSTKAKIAEGKATRIHSLVENTHPFEALASGHAMNGTSSSSVGPAANGHVKSGQVKSSKRKTSKEDFEDISGFIRHYLAGLGYSAASPVTCNALDRLEWYKESASSETDTEAIVRIFDELRIPMDTKALVAYTTGAYSSRYKQRPSSPRSKQQQQHTAKSKHASKPDPEAFKAALAKHGFTANITPLTPAAGKFMQTGSWHGSDAHLSFSDESPPPSDDDYDNDDDSPPCMFCTCFTASYGGIVALVVKSVGLHDENAVQSVLFGVIHRSSLLASPLFVMFILKQWHIEYVQGVCSGWTTFAECCTDVTHF